MWKLCVARCHSHWCCCWRVQHQAGACGGAGTRWSSQTDAQLFCNQDAAAVARSARLDNTGNCDSKRKRWQAFWLVMRCCCCCCCCNRLWHSARPGGEPASLINSPKQTDFQMYLYFKIINIDVKYILLFIVCKIFYVFDIWCCYCYSFVANSSIKI